MNWLRRLFQVKKENKKDSHAKKYDLLDKYGEDLTAIARTAKNPVTGMPDETDQCIVILLKMRYRSPILVGEPGVGKTAILQGLAQLIVDNLVPEGLMDCKRLISINTGDLIADAKDYEEFDRKLMAVLKEVASSNGQIILVIDNIHEIFGFDGAARFRLKGMLERKEIRCIGATTSCEYRKCIDKDPSLSLRFHKVLMKQSSEPSENRISRAPNGSIFNEILREEERVTPFDFENMKERLLHLEEELHNYHYYKKLSTLARE